MGVRLTEIVRGTRDGVIVAVHVQPRADHTAITGTHGDALKIRVAAAPVDGHATEAARDALATAVGVPAAAVTLVSGERSRLKRFHVADLPESVVVERLERVLAG